MNNYLKTIIIKILEIYGLRINKCDAKTDL